MKCVIWKGDLINCRALDLILTNFKPSKQAA